MNEPHFTVINLGCKVNRVESDTITSRLIASGALPTPLEETDLVIINTCTVTAEADAKARKALHHAMGRAGEVPIIVTGCAVAIDPVAFSSLSEQVICLPDKTAVPARACEILGCELALATSFDRVGAAFRSRAGIKIQDGCDRACTYCIVHLARGPLWSKPSSQVIEEVRRAELSGVREVVLSGVNLGNYHSDRNLTALLEGILESTDQLRCRLSSIEPTEIDDPLIDLIAQSNGRICRHLHLPLQSGSDTTLLQMGRTYDSSGYLDLVNRLYERIPSISLTTDVIAGFPGETDEAFEESMELCRRVAFSKMHVFRYSRRAGTPAAVRTDQLEPKTIALRARRMRELAEVMRAAFAAKSVGCGERLLIESAGHATSESYLPAILVSDGHPDATASPGSLIRVRVLDVSDNRLICEKNG